MLEQPCLRRAPQPALLLRRHHLERVAEPGPALRLHLTEDDPPPAARDHVQLVAARPDVAAEDAVAAQPVPEHRPVLGAPAGSAFPHPGEGTPSRRMRLSRIRDGTQDSLLREIDDGERPAARAADDEVAVAVEPQPEVPDLPRLELPRH